MSFAETREETRTGTNRSRVERVGRSVPYLGKKKTSTQGMNSQGRIEIGGQERALLRASGRARRAEPKEM